IVGYSGVTFLHQPDGALSNDLPLREHLVREIRTFRPDAVLTHDPEVVFFADGGGNHTDHRTAGLAATDAVYPAARNPMAFPALVRKGLGPHRVRALYPFWRGQPPAWFKVSGTVARKAASPRATVSKTKDQEGLEKRLKRWPRRKGERIERW